MVLAGDGVGGGEGGGDTRITEPAQRYVYPLSIFWLFELSLAEWNFVSHTYLTRLVTYVTYEL